MALPACANIHPETFVLNCQYISVCIDCRGILNKELLLAEKLTEDISFNIANMIIFLTEALSKPSAKTSD